MKKDFLKNVKSNDELFFNAFQYASIGMALVAPDGKWLLVNKSLCDLTGYNEEELMETTFQDITHPDDLEEDLDYVNRILSGDLETYQMEKRYFHKDGRTIFILLSVSLVKNKNGSPLFFISQIQDITDRKLLEKELVRQATTDLLTSINNRRQFYDLTERDILRSARYNEPLVLLMIDIDHFKKVNDTYGHGVGDEALKKMADVCRSELRSFDIFGRIGGEEFSILLAKTDVTLGFKIAERLRKSVERNRLITDKGVVKFTISIGGIAFSGARLSLESRMKQADQALYEAKNSGRNRTVIENNLAETELKKESPQKGFVRLEWDRAYESGHKLIDEQHQGLFRLTNMLLAAMIEPQEKTVCQQHMDELISEVSEHFKTEERLIETAGYPYASEHKKLHRKLINRAVEIARLHKRGQMYIGDVFHFLAVQVVSQHIIDEDRNFFSSLQSHSKSQ